MKKQAKIYLAGPDVFKDDAKSIGLYLKGLCTDYSFEGVFPLDNDIDFSGFSKYEMGIKIFEENRNLIHNCHAVLANLKPFRGPSADVGTVWECAYAKGLGMPVVGYSEFHISDYKTKVIGKVPHDGMSVEDFGVWDNIMLVHSLDYFGRVEDCLKKLREMYDA